MADPKRKAVRRKAARHDAFTFASVGLAAASGRIPMDVFARYLEALRPVAPKKRSKKR